MTDKIPPSADTLLKGAASRSAKTPEEIAKEYDLLPKLMPYLDRHLVFPLLEFASGQEEGDEQVDELTKAKYELLKQTNMTDYVANLWQEINNSETMPEEFVKKREEVVKKLQQYVEDSSKITELLQDDNVVSNLRNDKAANLKFLEEQHGVTMDMVNILYDYGRFQYSCGSYANAAELLYQFRVLSTDNDKVASATWGKLASEILTTNWEAAMEEVQKVKESIDTRLFNNPLAQLQHRTWLIHWSLFPFFNHDPARDTLTDLFFSPAYINTIQTACPWILRYLAAAVITSRSRAHKNTSLYQKQLKDLIRVVRQEQYEYQDPIVDFIKALYIDFDFEGAQQKLGEAEEILRNDFFLVAAADAFVDAARHLISESYCKIHQRIDIKDLSTRLGLNQDEGEKWIVNLIRDTRVDAKIDYKEGTVLMNHPPQSVYQQVIERTKGAFFRTQVLSAAVAK
ncbi:eukaryotic translation initiation factor 3 subunit 6 [Histoplasma capsulatum G186AR]|uniref:Eukaryotic translation initiation factor 3 subunit E n=2 Tax=Ajellomyces capsulatus TaxID=5037 RepID=C0NV20_AJECG|nr:eukaryotic translation initiation factor 3 subunit 6 [Histoplasma capsulatum G186AR]EEH04833.1 eukaryotic translation initiation factor 3 subunit 6 [Histoplasma capsulatum G186AR]KAG5287490.1 eukaryotic translation initiation factor 3 subunit 6 [Histoplasma capsulatum]QSS70697.1 eukaryotic translation initiation factor 3 subunit 6 [Histoplasma capsulatum G186AR]